MLDIAAVFMLFCLPVCLQLLLAVISKTYLTLSGSILYILSISRWLTNPLLLCRLIEAEYLFNFGLAPLQSDDTYTIGADSEIAREISAD